MANPVKRLLALTTHNRIRPAEAVDQAPTSAYASARSRATGPTTALWHAVEVHRTAEELDAACELTVCGVLARIDPTEPWPPAVRDLCPACCALAH